MTCKAPGTSSNPRAPAAKPTVSTEASGNAYHWDSIAEIESSLSGSAYCAYPTKEKAKESGRKKAQKSGRM